MADKPEGQGKSAGGSTPEQPKPFDSELLVPAALLKSEPVVPLDVIETLAQSDPEGVVKLLEGRDARLAELYGKREENYAKREENRHQESLAGETTKRMGMGLIFATIISVLVYAGVTADKASFDKILTAALAAFGGAGAVATFSNKSKQRDD
ncbi:MAG: hypothetical protein HC866_09875 [Leptolyngbyaceae cyanobacterium RU_5_1]|nr:hypothetical protein [Leptolyngbyaceae cyanobacterium RU_5_1]